MSHAHHQARGFTLIEVLVALALMSLIGTILIESLRIGGHAWQHVTRTTANIDEITRVREFLRQRLGAILPPEGGITTSPESFVGGTDTLEFSSPSPAYSDRGLMRYRLGLSATDPGVVEIRYRRELKEPDVAPTAGWTSEPLVSHVTGLSIQFWEDSAGSPARWVEYWGDTSKLPRLIRIDIHFADDDPRRWPPLYVQPQIDTRASCMFDVVSRRCRAAV